MARVCGGRLIRVSAVVQCCEREWGDQGWARAERI